MGREVRRVQAGFDWPLKKTWHGFLNPHYKKCPDCRNGHTVAREYLERIVSLLLMADDDAQSGRQHPYFSSFMFTDKTAEPELMREIVRPLVGEDHYDTRTFGHDAINNWRAVSAALKAFGLPDGWGVCVTCDGHALDPAQREAYESWEETEPPTGDAWQMWETTSEGSPISPPCDSPEALADWLATNNASSNGASTATYGQWLRMIRGPGFAPSMIARDGVIQSGVEAVGK